MRHLLLLILLATASARALACPEGRALAVVVPFPAGGSLDATTRVLADAVSPLLGRPLLIRNVPGASGLIAVKEALAAPPDGCTVLAATTTAVVLVPLRNENAGFTARSLRPVAKIGASDLVLIAAASFPPRSVAELAPYARRRGSPLSAGHPGHDSVQAIALEMVRERTHAELVQVAYNGSARLVTDLLGGHIDLAVVARPAAEPLVQHQGRAKILATLSRRNGYDVESWSGWFVPAGVPAAATAALRSALLAALDDEDVQRTLLRLGASTPRPGAQEHFAEEIRRSQSRYAKLVRSMATPAK
jgi:tripartite-type tricarboxylate transporter receptor subunit TctC